MSSNNDFADLEIRVLAQDGAYAVELTLNNERQFARGRLEKQAWVASADARADGERLFNWLFADDVLKAAWAEVRGRYSRRRLRLRLDADVPELHAVPWELLREPGESARDLAASSATPFSRYLAGAWHPGAPVFDRPVKILVAIANPHDLEARFNLQPVEVDAEMALLTAATEGLPVELIALPQPCTLETIAAAVAEHGVHILHIIAHGSFTTRDEGKAVLFLADGDNATRLVDGADFAAMLARRLQDQAEDAADRLRLVFLASCQTASRSPADAFRGLAPALVAAGIPAVLAMQDLVPVITAQAFAQAFYSRLLEHGLVDLASNEARATLLDSDLPGAAIPVLFTRLRAGQLLGQFGRISSQKGEEFWPFLLRRIDEGECVPFIGPRALRGLLPSRGHAATILAEKYGYPLEDVQNLARVAQYGDLQDRGAVRSDYMSLMKRGLLSTLGVELSREERQRWRKATFSEMVTGLNWAEEILKHQETEIHHQLARLPLPLFITTNFDNFMTEALSQQKLALPARRLVPRWQREDKQSHITITPPPDVDRPVVFYLNGNDEDLDHLLLSEDDFVGQLLAVHRDQDAMLPVEVLTALTKSSYLFLGYSLDDWEFRIILQALLHQAKQQEAGNRVHVGVQLEQSDVPDNEKALGYLERYLGRFHIDIYWGSVEQFVTELDDRWQSYLADVEEDDDFL